MVWFWSGFGAGSRSERACRRTTAEGPASKRTSTHASKPTAGSGLSGRTGQDRAGRVDPKRGRWVGGWVQYKRRCDGIGRGVVGLCGLAGLAGDSRAGRSGQEGWG